MREPFTWTREQTENLCSYTGVALGIGIGVSIFICPAITPWLIGAAFGNDAVNVGCRIADVVEDSSLDNAIEIGFGAIGFGVDFVVIPGISNYGSIIFTKSNSQEQ